MNFEPVPGLAILADLWLAEAKEAVTRSEQHNECPASTRGGLFWSAGEGGGLEASERRRADARRDRGEKKV